MCFIISYLYPCGHTEEEISDACNLMIVTGGVWCEKQEEQAVVMSERCIECKIAADQAQAEEKEIEEAWDV